MAEDLFDPLMVPFLELQRTGGELGQPSFWTLTRNFRPELFAKGRTLPNKGIDAKSFKQLLRDAGPETTNSFDTFKAAVDKHVSFANEAAEASEKQKGWMNLVFGVPFNLLYWVHRIPTLFWSQPTRLPPTSGGWDTLLQAIMVHTLEQSGKIPTPQEQAFAETAQECIDLVMLSSLAYQIWTIVKAHKNGNLWSNG